MQKVKINVLITISMGQYMDYLHRRMGAVGIESTETEVEGFTVIRKLVIPSNPNT